MPVQPTASATLRVHDQPLDTYSYPSYDLTSYISRHSMLNSGQASKSRAQFEASMKRLTADPTNPSLLAAYATFSKEFSSLTALMAAIPENLQKQVDGVIRRM